MEAHWEGAEATLWEYSLENSLEACLEVALASILCWRKLRVWSSGISSKPSLGTGLQIIRILFDAWRIIKVISQ